MDKSISCWREQSLASPCRCRCCFRSAHAYLRELRGPKVSRRKRDCRNPRATLGILFIAVMPPRAMRTAETDAIEFALLLLLMLMVTPLSFGYFYSWLMLPFAVITQRVLSVNHFGIAWWSLPALVLLAVGLIFPRGAQLYGNTFFATLLLFIGLSMELLYWNKQESGNSLKVNS